MRQKPKDIAKLLGKSVEEMLEVIDNTSSGSLSELAKSNPNKYEVMMLGIAAKNLNITVEELVKWVELKQIIEAQLKENLENESVSQ